MRLAITDDGRGFVLKPGEPMQLDLRSMQECAGEGGVALRVDSALGKGTRVVLDWSGSSPAPDQKYLQLAASPLSDTISRPPAR